jgi:hypothetical protein
VSGDDMRGAAGVSIRAALEDDDDTRPEIMLRKLIEIDVRLRAMSVILCAIAAQQGITGDDLELVRAELGEQS